MRLVHKIKLRYLLIISLMWIFLLYIIRLFSYYVQFRLDPVIIYWKEPDNNIACHDSYENDGLMSTNHPEFKPKKKSIFFHETSCRGGVDSVQACSVESAARTNPNWDVYLLFNSPVPKNILKLTDLAKLTKFPNIKLARIHADEYSKKLAVNRVVMGALKKSHFPYEHMGDIMKMLTLYKFGGVYFDLGQLVVKSLDTLPRNWLVRDMYGDIVPEAMGFSRFGIGNKITHTVLEQIAEDFSPYTLTSSARILQKALYSMCKGLENVHINCGVKMLNHTQFYPLHNSQEDSFEKPFVTNIEFDNILNSSNFYTLNWQKIRKKLFSFDKKSVYLKLARKYCPSIHAMYGDHFGV